MVSRHQDALARLRQLGRAEEPRDAEPQADPGWTPTAPEVGSRHRREGAPIWRVGWRAGVLLCLVVVLGAAGWVVRSSASTETPVEPRVTMSTASASAEPPAEAPSPVGQGDRSATSAEVVVHVVGAVASPGVVRLPGGSRVADAVAAAGGANPDADLSVLNLARPVTDGEQVTVSRPGDPVPVAAPAPGSAEAPGQPTGQSSGAAAAPGPLNLNTASESELDALPGIGPVLAARIVEWRTANGRFTSVDELGEVSGIGDKLLSRLRDQVIV